VDKLKKYYLDRMRYLLVASVILFLLIYYLVNTIATRYISPIIVDLDPFLSAIISVLIDLGSPIMIVLLIYNRMERYIREDAWKKKYPELDISGPWHGKTEFLKCFDAASGYRDPHPDARDTSDHMDIIQDCLHLEVHASSGTDANSNLKGFSWKSYAVDMRSVPNGFNLRILYMIKYTNEMRAQGYPEEARGYIKLESALNDPRHSANTHVVKGTFRHCVPIEKDKVAFSGDLEYIKTSSRRNKQRDRKRRIKTNGTTD